MPIDDQPGELWLKSVSERFTQTIAMMRDDGSSNFILIQSAQTAKVGSQNNWSRKRRSLIPRISQFGPTAFAG
jgi:hypothetical protein